MKKIGAAIVAGGKSRRMGGTAKGLLNFQGKTFLQNITEQIADFPEIYLSVADDSQYPESSLQKVIDKYPQRGPLGGIASVLSVCQMDAMLVLSCDIPFFSKEAAKKMTDAYDEAWDAWIPVDKCGRKHPLCGIYHSRLAKEMLSFLEREEKSGVLQFLENYNVRWVHSDELGLSDEIFQNINTIEQYDAFCMEGIE